MKKINLKDFVLSFCMTRNAEESALNAGVIPRLAKLEGNRLLARKGVKEKIKAEEKLLESSEMEVIAGLERLAFGRINDAVKLALSEDFNVNDLTKAELFNVSEIKKVKGGGVEIKFCDRQKALEKLWEYREKIETRKNAGAFEELFRSADSENDTNSAIGDDDIAKD
ncbi:MAG: terminase small subunit [Oscillospiraceae bacterium]